MAINLDLVKINNQPVPALRQFDVSREKLANSAGRTMDGILKQTIIGKYPKITAGFSYLSDSQMQTLINLLDADSFMLSWFDQATNTIKTGQYYAGPYPIQLDSKHKARYKPFTVNLIPYNPLT